MFNLLDFDEHKENTLPHRPTPQFWIMITDPNGLLDKVGEEPQSQRLFSPLKERPKSEDENSYKIQEKYGGERENKSGGIAIDSKSKARINNENVSL